MKHSILTILFFVLCFTMNAQTFIKGKVTDNKGNPLPEVSVFLPDQNKGSLCNEDGEYIIENIPTGKVFVQFSYIGYNTEIKSLIAEQGMNELNTSLTEATIEVQEVVVSGGIVSSQRDNAVKIAVLKLEDIQLSGTPNLMEALTAVPGVDMISQGQGMSKPVIRGLSMNGILITKDGTRIENYQYSTGHPAGIDDNGAGKVEIIKGPASLLYGSDAVGGVINFISETPAPRGKIEGSYSAQLHSNTLGLNNNLTLKGASKHFFAGLSVNYKTHADYEQGGGKYVPNSRFNEWSTGINTGYNAKIGTFNLSYYYYKQQIGMTMSQAIPLITERGRKNEIWYQDPHHHLISSRNKLFIGNLRCDVNAAWQSNLRSAYNTTDVPFVEMQLNTFTYETKIHLPSNEKSDYIIGIQGMEQLHKNVNDRMSQSLPDADVSRIGVMAFAQYTFDKLKLQGGLRFDLGEVKTEETSLSKKFTTPNGSLGATYLLNEKMTLRANFAKACRMPNLRELSFTGLKGNIYEVAGENLVQEDAYESDISFHYQGNSLSVDVALFYNHINNYIYLAPTGDTTSIGVYIYQTTQNNANLYGGEAGFHYHPSFVPWLHLKGTYSSVTGKRNGGEYLPYIPAHKFRYEAGFEKKSAWLFDNIGLYVSALTALSQDNPSQFETKTDGYTLFNIKGNANIKISNQLMVIGLTVNNIFDKKYIDHLSTLKSMNYYNPGRNICLSLKVPFGIK
jgi:iron complex outermembrane receptor protein